MKRGAYDASTRRPYTEADDARLLELKGQGLNFRQIGEIIGRKHGSVEGRYRKLWAAGKDGTLAPMRPEVVVAPAIVTNLPLREREPTPCTFPLDTLVMRGRVTGIRT